MRWRWRDLDRVLRLPPLRSTRGKGERGTHSMLPKTMMLPKAMPMMTYRHDKQGVYKTNLPHFAACSRQSRESLFLAYVKTLHLNTLIYINYLFVPVNGYLTPPPTLGTHFRSDTLLVILLA